LEDIYEFKKWSEISITFSQFKSKKLFFADFQSIFISNLLNVAPYDLASLFALKSFWLFLTFLQLLGDV